MLVPEDAIVPEGERHFVYRVADGSCRVDRSADRQAQRHARRSAQRRQPERPDRDGRTVEATRRHRWCRRPPATRRWLKRHPPSHPRAPRKTHDPLRSQHSPAGPRDRGEPDHRVDRPDRVGPPDDPRIPECRRSGRDDHDELSRRKRRDHRVSGDEAARRRHLRHRRHRLHQFDQPCGAIADIGALQCRARSRFGRERRARPRRACPQFPAEGDRQSDRREGRVGCDADHLHGDQLRPPQRNGVDRLRGPCGQRPPRGAARRRADADHGRTALFDARVARSRPARRVFADAGRRRARAHRTERRGAGRPHREQRPRIHRVVGNRSEDAATVLADHSQGRRRLSRASRRRRARRSRP